MRIVTDLIIVKRTILTVATNVNKRRKKNETNQSVKSERHRNVNIVGDNSRMCWKHFPVAVQAIYICISLMFAVFGVVFG